MLLRAQAPKVEQGNLLPWFTMVMTTVVHCLRMRIKDLGGVQSCSSGRSTSLRDLSNINKGPCLCDVRLIFGKPIWNRIMRGCMSVLLTRSRCNALMSRDYSPLCAQLYLHAGKLQAL